MKVPIPSEKNRNAGVIPFLGHIWILRVHTDAIGSSPAFRMNFYQPSNDLSVQGGPLPVINGVITPLSGTYIGVITYNLLKGLITYLYRGYNPVTKYHGHPSNPFK